MFAYELEGLKRLNIKPIKWGSSYRLKVRGRTGKMVFIGNVSNPKNQRLIAKQYKISIDKLKTNLSRDFKLDPKYKFQGGMYGESHLYENIPTGEFYDKLENVLLTQNRAYKVNLALGYTLYDPVNDESFYFYPNIANTNVYDKPFVVNSRADARKVITDIRTKELSNTLNYPKSGVKVKEITAFKIYIDFRNHALGDSDALVPEFIKNNRYIINFPRTNNKCVFFCIAYHQQEEKNRRKVVSHVKEAFKCYCNYKGLTFSLSLYKSFKPIDLFEFDQLEECFGLNINVYTFDVETNAVECKRPTEGKYDDTLNILSHDNHAFYLTNVDRVQSRFNCPKCCMVFDTCERMKDHTKNKCDQVNLESFPKLPTIYKPAENRIKKLITKYNIKRLDHYLDHFIVFDFEAILKPIAQAHGDKTTFDNQHIPVSVSISNSLTNEIRCFVSEEPKQMVDDMISYLNKISDDISDWHKDKFKAIYFSIRKRLSTLERANEGIMDGITMENIKQKRKDEPELNSFIKQKDSITKDLESLDQILEQTPVVGYNTGNYDINLIKNELFSSLGTENIKHVIKNGGYMAIATKRLKFLDIMNYVPAGTSYDKYLETYLGGCKCEDKIRCTCEMTKGVFPYEYITSFSVLNETQLPPKSAFYSKLRCKHISNEDYERAKFVWNHYQMKTLKDFLIWYNNLDVGPFIKAILKQRELFKRFDLDIFCDGVSLPGLSEKVMYKTQELIFPKKEPGEAFDFPEKRYLGYIKQDEEAKREFSMTIQHLDKLLKKCKYMCSYCYCKLNEDNVSADRINNKKGHEDGNIIISCVACNCARVDMNIKAFRYKKLIEFNADRLVYSIDEEESDIYRKMKANIAGGPSIIFSRYAKRNETKIRGGKLCKKVIGYDANALYLWCLGNVMPCGRLTTIEPYDDIVDDIKSDKVFGFLECDIETPEHLKDYFSEMTPIFKNTEIEPTEEIIGKHMYDYNQTRGKNMSKASRKLIGSYFGKQILIYTPLLKWYLEHGMVITKTYSFIKANAHKAFKPFMEAMSQARRDGNADESKKMVGTMMKLVGNSAFGRSGMDMSKHKEVEFMSDDKSIFKAIEHFTFSSKTELNDGTVEMVKSKRRIKLRNPIHLSIAIYQLAKLRMLQFYYDCIDFYFDRSDFEYQEMDTDSGYIAFSHEDPFPNLIKPDLLDHYKKHKYEWFPRDDTPENNAYDTFTPGLFKEEFRCNAMVSLSSKNYICYLGDKIDKETKQPMMKLSAKGVQKSRNKNVLSPENFESVVKARTTFQGNNKGFRMCRETNSMITYSQTKTALNYYYDKRKVLEDGITTIPLDL